VRVAVEGELYAGVPCEMLDELGVHAPAGKQREARVPEIVPAYIGQSCSLEQGLEMAVDDVLRIERCPLGSGEDEPGVLVRTARSQLLLNPLTCIPRQKSASSPTRGITLGSERLGGRLALVRFQFFTELLDTLDAPHH
jgi:hypothetical protein